MTATAALFFKLARYTRSPLLVRPQSAVLYSLTLFAVSGSGDFGQPWFRQAASRLQHEAIARNPRQDRRVPGAETQSRDGRVAQLAEQLTLNQ
jgi:hypothetical protein